jgi:hypothetical protein
MTPDIPRTHVLTHLLPGNVVAEARDLALSFQREELFRVYVLKHIWLVIPASLVFCLVSGASAAGVVLFIAQFFGQPMNGWSGTLVLAVGMLAWLAAMISQLYCLFSWLQVRALRKSPIELLQMELPLDSPVPSRPGGTMSSIWLIVTFVVLPLLALAALSSSFAVFLIAVLVFAPIIYTMFDR